MNVKYQLRTEKIKGLDFHSTKSWIITSTYKGNVQIIDFRIASVLKSYAVSPDSVSAFPTPKIDKSRKTQDFSFFFSFTRSKLLFSSFFIN